ncbi:hypothetical protein CRENBAI_003826 [Crenichthys baileyi]|uniref:Uncharacterized protein n=1 Tax=Crenichthys baileyi TaxID=28760 RepID=A0AAV9S243_9TELE
MQADLGCNCSSASPNILICSMTSLQLDLQFLGCQEAAVEGEVLELGQVQLIMLISWAVYEEPAPALRCLSVLPLRCTTSGSDGVDQRLEVNQFEPIPGLNLWADSSASLQPSESCSPSQHLPFGPSRQPRRVKLTTLSHTTGSMTISPGGFPCAYL